MERLIQAYSRLILILFKLIQIQDYINLKISAKDASDMTSLPG